MLILFFHLTPAAAVGTALTFAAINKLAVRPVYVWRRQIDYRILVLLVSGVVPGVLLGVYALSALNVRDHERILFLVLGLMIVTVSLGSVYRTLRNASLWGWWTDPAGSRRSPRLSGPKSASRR